MNASNWWDRIVIAAVVRHTKRLVRFVPSQRVVSIATIMMRNRNLLQDSTLFAMIVPACIR